MTPKEENNMVKVNITGLYNLVEKKVAVEPRFILNEAKAWYEGISLKGLSMFSYFMRMRMEKELKNVALRLIILN